jgi:hypothetical protein
MSRMDTTLRTKPLPIETRRLRTKAYSSAVLG